ncbi:MAG: 30S ribosomal protein S6 [Candidatus Staskawiczbacteria bacterium]|jgi:small subunit ribosomal protein S6
MKTYELVYIVSPEITSEEAESKAKEIESTIQEREGKILKNSNPIAKTLSYQIEKRASGYFGVIEFQLEPEKLLEVKDIVVKDKKIVRHMLVIKEAVEFKKQRRTRENTKEKTLIEEKPSFTIESKKIETDSPKTEQEEALAKNESKPKVELKDIEHELDELLGE